MFILNVHQLTIKSTGNILLNNISLNINQGEQWLLAGTSSANTTALLQALAGRLHPQMGSVTFNKPANFTTQHPIAMVSSHYHFKDRSNTQNLYYQQRYNSADSDQVQTVEEYLNDLDATNDQLIWTLQRVTHRLQLSNLLDKHLIELSNGETKRLLIAAALLKNPVLLLLENPLTGLDTTKRDDFNNLLTELHQSGITTVITSDHTYIPPAITHVALLKNNALDQAGSVKDLQYERLLLSETKPVDEELLKTLLIQPETSCQHIVDMQNVNIIYNNKAILNNINWHIKPGERWCLQGPNGSGKSTLLSLINGDNPQAYANHIVLFDRKRGTGESIWDIKKKIGYVSPELYQYFPTNSTVLQAVESGFYDTVGLFRPSQPLKLQTAMQWIRLMGLEADARKLLKNLPANAQRLTLLARALVKNPPLLILDEPCQGLDTQQRNYFVSLIDAVCRLTPVTIIYVTHYAEELPKAINKKISLAEGSIVSITSV